MVIFGRVGEAVNIEQPLGLEIQSLTRCHQDGEPRRSRQHCRHELRPAIEQMLNEKAAGAPAWKSTPSWFVWGELDKNIPTAAHRFMAERAKAREALEVKGASHVVFVSYADTVAGVILRAAKSTK